MKKIELICLGKVDEKILAYLKIKLAEKFGQITEIGPVLDKPTYAFHSKRGQYNSVLILQELASFKLHHKLEHYILAILDGDLFVPEFNFIFGQADQENKLAIIGLARLRQEFYQSPKDETIFLARVLKEAVHELGHNYKLTHCKKDKCVMYFSNSIFDTDRKFANFCFQCLEKLNKEQILDANQA